MLVYGCDAGIRTDLENQLSQEGFLTDAADTEDDIWRNLNQYHYDGITICTRQEQDLARDRLAGTTGSQRDIPVPVFTIPYDYLEKQHHGKLPRLAVLDAGASEQPVILHVEDNPVMSAIVASTLQDTGNIINTGSMEEARIYLSQVDFDLVILDLTLPDGSGLDLLQHMWHAYTDLPVVIHSTWEITDNLDNIRAVLNKSYTTPVSLLQTIKSIVH
jgi:CheY-like chemotaxis protein